MIDGRPDRVLLLFAFAQNLFLGINKQLDLQVGLIRWSRHLIKSMGLFAYRRSIQIAFVSVMVCCLFVLAAVLWKRATFRGTLHRWIFLALCVQWIFVLIRAFAFQHVDRCWAGKLVHGQTGGYWSFLGC